MRKSFFIILLSFFLLTEGCVSHSMWVEDRDTLIGTKFDPNSERNEKGNIFSYGFDGMNKAPKSGYYRMDQKPPNTRYYIRWTNHCRYSLLVAPDGTILSWRFEDTKDPEQACVIH